MKRLLIPILLVLLFPLACTEVHQEPGGSIDPSPEMPSWSSMGDEAVPTSETPELAVSRLDNYFTRRSKYHGFNGTVLYAVDGVVEYSKAFGFSNLRNRDTLGLESSFQLASVSKPITALATLLLVDQGLISLEDTIQTIFPDFPYKNISIQLLLK